MSENEERHPFYVVLGILLENLAVVFSIAASVKVKSIVTTLIDLYTKPMVNKKIYYIVNGLQAAKYVCLVLTMILFVVWLVGAGQGRFHSAASTAGFTFVFLSSIANIASIILNYIYFNVEIMNFTGIFALSVAGVTAITTAMLALKSTGTVKSDGAAIGAAIVFGLARVASVVVSFITDNHGLKSALESFGTIESLKTILLAVSESAVPFLTVAFIIFAVAYQPYYRK